MGGIFPYMMNGIGTRYVGKKGEYRIVLLFSERTKHHAGRQAHIPGNSVGYEPKQAVTPASLCPGKPIYTARNLK